MITSSISASLSEGISFWVISLSSGLALTFLGNISLVEYRKTPTSTAGSVALPSSAGSDAGSLEKQNKTYKKNSQIYTK